MNKILLFGSLLVGFALCIGCDEPAATLQDDSGTQTSESAQQLTEEVEGVVVEETMEITEESAPEEAAPTEEAAPEAAPEVPAAEEAAPAASDAP